MDFSSDIMQHVVHIWTKFRLHLSANKRLTGKIQRSQKMYKMLDLVALRILCEFYFYGDDFDCNMYVFHLFNQSMEMACVEIFHSKMECKFVHKYSILGKYYVCCEIECMTYT
ncbi:hypothetical protein ACF0H5_008506 [Mactra antiquata]